MKPSGKTNTILALCRAINKSIEYSANINYSQETSDSIVNLLDLGIGLLGDESVNIINNAESEIDFESLRFSSIYFETLAKVNLITNKDEFKFLGACAYYLCNFPGNAQVLIKEIRNANFTFHSNKID